ncbi:MAG TPA: helix-turn-helix transcriptional regulator [Pseudonocardiaceae bacterium]|nr:helix-turn-helix transcriptional regulator [Pseudonocardiaceae bacterium]
MDSTNVLGNYLRARRELVRPEDVGIKPIGLRRVPGLRREEVAMLAGISSDYYLRLEQGRDRHPSTQVLEAIAAVLRLDADSTRYLLSLAGTRSAHGRKSAARARPTLDQVPESIVNLINGWPTNPAYVQNKFTDILAVNPLAAALSPNYAPGVNLLRAAFLDPTDQQFRADWAEATEEGVASLRAHAGSDVDNPRFVELVGELSVRSERFRQLWGRADVVVRMSRVSRLNHPQVGEIEVQSNKFTINGTDGLMLVVFHAPPTSRSAELLGILGSLAAAEHPAAGTPATPQTPTDTRPH